MRISRVTMTGADDSISPAALAPISKDYPFVEWGILRSRSQEGGKRFPTRKWVKGLNEVRATTPMNLCAHLCGKYVREVLEKGHFAWLEEETDEYTNLYDRIQLNFHAERHTIHPEFVDIIGNAEYEFIFQMDGTEANEAIYHKAAEHAKNVFPLFDISGGIGAVPEHWPAPFPGVYCGYAGGLGPDTLAEQLKKIEAVVGDREIWIDMETRIRSLGDTKFDLEKVVACLELAKPYV